MKKLTAEFLGTFFLVFIGTGAIILNDVWEGAITNVGVSLVFGVLVAIIILATGKISGAHLNPAVTLALRPSLHMPTKDVVLYIAAQVLGATSASFALHSLFPSHETLGATLPSAGLWQSVVAEVLLTTGLVCVVFWLIARKLHSLVPLALVIGVYIVLASAIGGPISGASMNPARSIGPALANGHVEYLWLYIIAPIIGGQLAWRICDKHIVRVHTQQRTKSDG